MDVKEPRYTATEATCGQITPVLITARGSALLKTLDAPPVKVHTRPQTGVAPSTSNSSGDSIQSTAMSKTFQILQANLGKSRMAQHSLMNDEGLQDYGMLLISEPAYFRGKEGIVIAPPSRHHLWDQFRPSVSTTDGYFPIRSLIYAKTEVHAQAIHIPSSDITGVRIRVQGRKILVISVYVPPGDVHGQAGLTYTITGGRIGFCRGDYF